MNLSEIMVSEFDQAFSNYAKLYVSYVSKGECYKLYTLAHEIMGMVYLMLKCNVIDIDTCSELLACINLKEIRYLKTRKGDDF